MAFRFTERPDGVIEATVGSGDELFDHALNDAISSRAPRGAVRQGLSTYWIDRTEEGLRRAIEHGLSEPFAAGNATYLRLSGDVVIAAYEFDPDESEAESLPVVDFLALLAEWRQRVIEAGGAHGDEAARLEDPPRPRPMGPVA